MKIPVLVEMDQTASAPAMTMGATTLAGVAELDAEFGAVPIPRLGRGMALMAAGPRAMVVRAMTPIEGVAELRKMPGVLGVYSDPIIAPMGRRYHQVAARSDEHGCQCEVGGGCGPLDCDSRTAKGGRDEVIAALGVETIWNGGYSGQGTVVGIVDGGVDRSHYPVIGGWSPNPVSPPGIASHWGRHGNMCAYDSLIAAPNAKIYDLGIGKTNTGVGGVLSAALQAFEWARKQYDRDGTPQVLSNSWGLYQRAWDPLPPGDPGNYTDNPAHPFNRKVIEVIDRGMLVCFAAGNCGDPCPDNRCGDDHGETRSIIGANGLERVICVAGVNVRHQRVGYGSEGPSSLAVEKPDICGYTHFAGDTSSDSGTSAACPVIAGVLALLRSALPPLDQDRAREALNRTAINVCAPGFDRQTGFGVVNPRAAYNLLTGAAPTLR